MTKPRCPYFSKCGGCSAQHIDYDIQLENKRKQLSSALRFEDVSIHSGEPYSYRNRMDLIFHAGGIGFRQKGRWQNIVDVKSCAISNDRLNQLISEVRSFFMRPDFFNIKRQNGTLRYAVIRTPTLNSSISFVLNSESSRIGEVIDDIKRFAESSIAESIAITYVPPKTDMSISEDYFMVKGSDIIKEEFLGKTFGFNIQGFFQNNTEMAEKMHRYVRSILERHAGGSLIDLYGGVGTFGIINADLFTDVMTIESFNGCTESAKENIKVNGVTNVTAYNLDAKQLRKLEIPKGSVIVTDPPRSGMHPGATSQMLATEPRAIVYISCNISQLKKEIGRFKDYKIMSAALFDLFPQTPHSEGVVELVRTNHDGS